jgi:SAM-dependent methyltransferase
MLTHVGRYVRRRAFSGSRRYWERHYAQGGTSGAGSAGARARFKAEVLNDLVARHGVGSVIEFGCGDGQQLALATYPSYLGVDVSPSVLRRTRDLFADDPTKSFLCYDPASFTDPARFVSADAAISLDVIYHLVEDGIYHLHLRHVFGAARRFVVLFTSDADTLATGERPAPHVRHRPVVRDVARLFPEWRLRERIPNRYPYQGPGTPTSFADFFIYEPATAVESGCWPDSARVRNDGGGEPVSNPE